MHTFLVVLIFIAAVIFALGYLWGVMLTAAWIANESPGYQQDQMLAYGSIIGIFAGVFWWLMLGIRLVLRRSWSKALVWWGD